MEIAKKARSPASKRYEKKRRREASNVRKTKPSSKDLEKILTSSKLTYNNMIC
jgi:hypothetical protein